MSGAFFQAWGGALVAAAEDCQALVFSQGVAAEHAFSHFVPAPPWLAAGQRSRFM